MFIEKSGTKKAIVYECLSADNCSEIIAKLNFLRVSYLIRCLQIILEKLGKAFDFEKKYLGNCHDKQ